MSTTIELVGNSFASPLLATPLSMAPILTANLSLPLTHTDHVSAAALLTDAEQSEVLRFLSTRPVHTAIMSGLIHDCGLESPDARGSFYGVRAEDGKLEGVALIGQTTIFEVASKRALQALARKAQQSSDLGLIFSEEKTFELFWRYYTGNNQPMPRRVRSQLLYDLQHSAENSEAPTDLRLATSADMEKVVTAHAVLAAEEWGTDSLETDWPGFRQRCARRISKGRVWISTQDDKLIFKADVAARTLETVYLEGIYVAPELRGRGVGSRYLAQLDRTLLRQAKNICLLVDECNHAARRLYDKCGYQLRGRYRLISLL